MDAPRYQIFVSSTYEDLKEARQQVIETIIDMHHMPAAMEQFPASPEDQFSYIKRIIADSDYYVLIIGGKYGSIEPESGKSYTQLEYEYAIEKEVPVLVFIRRHNKMLASEIETDVEKQKKLQGFIQDIGKLAVMWNEPQDLPKKIMQSLNEAIKNFKRIGWVRAGQADSAETLSKLVTAQERISFLEKENDNLKTELEKLIPSIPDIAELDDTTEITIKIKDADLENSGDRDNEVLF